MRKWQAYPNNIHRKLSDSPEETLHLDIWRPSKPDQENNKTHSIVLGQDHPPFAMTDEGPSDVALLELLDRDLARESPVRLVEHVLGRDLDALAQMLAHDEQVQRWGRDDDLYLTL